MTITKRIASAALAFSLMATSSLPVFANNNEGVSAGVTITTETKHNKDKTPVDLACMQTAVVARDDAILAAFDTYHANVKTALIVRRDALRAAWTLTDRDSRKEAIKKARSDFKGTWKKERKALNEAKRTAWKNFREASKTCHARGEGEDQGNDRDL